MKIQLKDIGLGFKDEGHIHSIKGIGEVPGCTSVSGLFGEDGWKFAWPVKLMEQGMVEQAISDSKDFPKGDSIFNVDYIVEMAKKYKNAWRQKRDKTKDLGVILHGDISRMIKEAIKAEIRILPIESVAKEFEESFKGFLEWQTDSNIEWLASEVQVGSLTHNYAGILDCIYKIGDKVYLDDIKTSDKPKKEWKIQLAGLKMALREQGVNVDETGILLLRREGEFERISMNVTEADEKAFLVGLEFYRQKNLFAGRNRKEKKK